jgi:hypothetical protein
MRKAISFLAIAALLLPSCDGALKENPTSFVSPGSFYSNEEEALAALSGAYAGINQGVFSSYIGSWQFQQMVSTPSAEVFAIKYAPGSVARGWDNWTWTPSQHPRNTLEGTYELAYQGINRANTVITRVPEIPDENIDPAVRSRIVAEARFIRAIHYYYLAGFFGRVPIVRQQTEGLGGLEKPNPSPDSAYTFAINTLENAIPDLPPRPEKTAPERASKGAAQTLLAKFYLQRSALTAENGLPSEFQIAQPGDAQQAADLLQQVINSGHYALRQDVQAQFRDLFIDEQTGPSNDEVIFPIQADQTVGEGNGLPCLVSPQESSNFASASWNQYASELPFYTSFKDEDVRQEVTFVTEYASEATGDSVSYDLNNVEGDNYLEDSPTIDKYARAADSESGCSDDNDIIFLRYADVLLMKAEALNEANGGPTGAAYDAINQVRERAGLEPLSGGLSYEAFREAVYTERRKELVTEGHDWHTVQRFFDIATERVREHAEFAASQPPERTFAPPPEFLEIDDPKDRFMPLPQSAIERNPQLTQNPGYGGN